MEFLTSAELKYRSPAWYIELLIQDLENNLYDLKCVKAEAKKMCNGRHELVVNYGKLCCLRCAESFGDFCNSSNQSLPIHEYSSNKCCIHCGFKDLKPKNI